MKVGKIIALGSLLAASALIALSACKKKDTDCDMPFVPPYDGGDMINTPIDQSVLFGVWKTEDGSSVISVTDDAHMVVTENGKLIFEGDVSLRKFGDLCFTDGKDGDGNDSNAPYPTLTFNTDKNVYKYRHLFDGTVVTFIKQAE